MSQKVQWKSELLQKKLNQDLKTKNGYTLCHNLRHINVYLFTSEGHIQVLQVSKKNLDEFNANVRKYKLWSKRHGDKNSLTFSLKSQDKKNSSRWQLSNAWPKFTTLKVTLPTSLMKILVGVLEIKTESFKI